MLIETLNRLAKVSADNDLFEGLVKDYQRRLDALPKTRADLARSGRPRAEVDRERADLEHALWLLENGVDWNFGIPFPELELLAGKPSGDRTHGTAKPGLRWLRVQKGRLEREVAELQALQAKWPTEETKRKFRYTGKADRFRWPTDEDPHRRLEPGDVVELTKARALAWRDMFEAVEVG